MDAALISKFLVFLSKESNDVFWIRSADYAKQIYISPAYETIWGRSAQDLYNFPEKWSEYLHPEDLEKMRASLTMRNPEILPGMQFFTEYRILRPSGELRYIQDHSFPVFDEAQQHLGFAGIARDVTDEKQLAQNLFKAKEAAESANRAKTEFLANMSHDMKTPLTGVVGMADLMAHDNGSREIDQKRAESIYDCGLQALSLFDSCLELSKMEMQEWETKSEIFLLKLLFEDIKALLAPKAQTQTLSLTLEYDELLPETVEGHRDSLYRVLLNLVSNALKFTERGGVILRAFKVDAIDNQQIMVAFQVQDSGIGIPEDKQKIIFEKLHRLTPSYKGQIEGSGIGLYIVDQYVKRMGGTIQVKSHLDEGSTFTITLPLKIASKKISFHNTPIPLTSQNNTPALSKEKGAIDFPHILIVEDMPLIQFVTKTLLTDTGFSVDVASTGEEALAMFSAKKYDLIYMDIGLPGIDGYATTQAIRANEKNNHAKLTPIIALTGHGAVDVQTFCGKAGMQGVLSKPLTREQAENVWRRYGKHEDVHVAGLTIL